jgi:hypothetical protein
VMMLNKVGYNPVDDRSRTGYTRPPKNAECILDYFHALGFLEDGGAFAISEMSAMLRPGDAFFAKGFRPKAHSKENR